MFIRKAASPLMGDIANLFKYFKELHIDSVVVEVQNGIKKMNLKSGVEWDIPRYFKYNAGMPIFFMHTIEGSDPEKEAKLFSARLKTFPKVAGAIVRVRNVFDARSVNAAKVYWDTLAARAPAGIEIGILGPGNLGSAAPILAMAEMADYGMPLISLAADDDPTGILAKNITSWQKHFTYELIPTTYIYSDDVYTAKPKNIEKIHTACISAADINGFGFWQYDPEPPATGFDGNPDIRQAIKKMPWINNNPTQVVTPTEPEEETPSEPSTPTEPEIPVEIPVTFELGFDVAYSDDKGINYDLLHDVGFKWMIAKIGQWNYKDPLFDTHMAGGSKAGIEHIGGYWYVNPNYDWRKQMAALQKALGSWSLEFAAADVEEAFEYLWIPKNKKKGYWKTNRVSGAKIADTGWNVLNGISALGLPAWLYSRTSFINEYSPQMLSYAYKYPNWLAAYPSKRVITCDAAEATANGYTYCGSWKEYFDKFAPPPTMAIALPKGVTAWKSWQFTGDCVKLPGTGGYIDLDYVRV